MPPAGGALATLLKIMHKYFEHIMLFYVGSRYESEFIAILSVLKTTDMSLCGLIGKRN